MGAPISLWHCIPSSHFIRGKDTHGTDKARVVSAALAGAASRKLRERALISSAPRPDDGGGSSGSREQRGGGRGACD